MARRKRQGKPALDDGKKREILAILAVGCSRRTAARYVGCSHTTIQRTALRDPAFAAALTRAESGAEFRYLKNIRDAAQKEQYWRAAAWVLERRNPEDFAARHPDVVTGEQMATFLAQVAEMITDALPAGVHRKSVLKRLEAMIGVFAKKAQGQGPEKETFATPGAEETDRTDDTR